MRHQFPDVFHPEGLPLLEKLVSEEQSFYAVINFLTILYELSVEENYKVLASSSFAK